MEVAIPYSKVNSAIEWAKENCPTYITYQVDVDTLVAEDIAEALIQVIFSFGNENDAVMFALRWQ